MTDGELDRLLRAWEAPAPPPSLREGLRARFPQAPRRSFARPLRWTLALAAAGALLTLGLGQSDLENWHFPVARTLAHLNHLYEGLVIGWETRQAPVLVAQIRQSHPQVYVDGQPAPPLEYGPAARMDVQIPGDGVYSLVLYPALVLNHAGGGWVQAGRAHGRMIEFQAGGRQVRIECSRQIVDGERPVFVRRRP